MDYCYETCIGVFTRRRVTHGKMKYGFEDMKKKRGINQPEGSWKSHKSAIGKKVGPDESKRVCVVNLDEND